MSVINRNSRIHVIKIDSTGKRWYLHKPDTTRNARGEIILWPYWDSDPAFSRPLSYEHALVLKRRMYDEHRVIVHFAFQAGDTAELIQD